MLQYSHHVKKIYKLKKKEEEERDRIVKQDSDELTIYLTA